MPEPYNLTTLQNSGNIVQLAQNTNTLAGGWLGALFLMTFFIILFISFKGYESKRAMAGATMISSAVAILERLLNLISNEWMYGAFLLTAISFMLMRWGD